MMKAYTPDIFVVSPNFFHTVFGYKTLEGTQTTQKSSQKSTQKSSLKIIELIKENSQITTQEIADLMGITRRGVAKHFKNLQEKGIIRRVGPDKGGHWEVMTPIEADEK